MFTQFFKRAEISVDNAIGDFFARFLVALSFIVAVGFAAASLSSAVNRAYGSETGNLILAAVFCALGGLIAGFLKLRNNKPPTEPLADKQEALAEPEPKSILDDEALMAVFTSAAPIFLPAVMRTVVRNWHILLAAAAGLYIFSKQNVDTGIQPAE